MSIFEEKRTLVNSRGAVWFDALTKGYLYLDSSINSLRVASGQLSGHEVTVISVVADTLGKFPRARQGEVGLLEGWGIAKLVRNVIEADKNKEHKTSIISIVDVPSQAYGRREELFGIHQALAAAVDSYAQARLAGHPVLSLLVGKSMSGGFLAHGYQANQILALNDPGVLIHAMGKESAARVTLRTVEELDALALEVPPMAYDVRSFASLGLVAKMIDVVNADAPERDDIQLVERAVLEAIQQIKSTGDVRFSNRFDAKNRALSLTIRERMLAQWFS